MKVWNNHLPQLNKERNKLAGWNSNLTYNYFNRFYVSFAKVPLFQTRNFDGARDHSDVNSVLVQSGNTYGVLGTALHYLHGVFLGTLNYYILFYSFQTVFRDNTCRKNIVKM